MEKKRWAAQRPSRRRSRCPGPDHHWLKVARGQDGGRVATRPLWQLSGRSHMSRTQSVSGMARGRANRWSPGKVWWSAWVTTLITKQRWEGNTPAVQSLDARFFLAPIHQCWAILLKEALHIPIPIPIHSLSFSLNARCQCQCALTHSHFPSVTSEPSLVSLQ